MGEGLDQLALSVSHVLLPAIPSIRLEGAEPRRGCSAVETDGDKRHIPKKTKSNSCD